MASYKFGVTWQERKRLAGAISEILNAPTHYCGMPTAAYEVGGYRIDKNGTVTGVDNYDLADSLFDRYEIRCLEITYDQPEIERAPAYEDLNMTEEEELGLGCTRRENWQGENGMQASDVPEPEQIAIEVPLDGFTPEAITNLEKLIASKAPIIKLALGVDTLPIEVLEDRISFPWFSAVTDNGNINAYAQFISALCNTAKEKKRVTAKAPADDFENPAFTMRVWLIGLGMVGAEYKLARKLMGANLPGNSAWRYGKPEKAPDAEVTPSETTVRETEVAEND